MQFTIRKEEIKLTGEEMQPHWAYINFGIAGNSIVSFVGPCDIKPENIIDLEEYKEGARIYADKMLHFIIEHFDTDLEKAILRQYLLISILEEKLNNRLKDRKILRWGDDLYDEDSKLTISAVSKNVVSTKIHLGVNITSTKVDTKTRGLEYYKIDPYELAEVIITQYRLENRRLKEKSWRMKAVL